MASVTVIKEGVVVNVVEVADGAAWQPPPDCILGPVGGDIGDLWNGKEYVPGPIIVSERRIRLTRLRERMATERKERLDRMTIDEKLALIGLDRVTLKAALEASRDPVR